MKKRNLFIFLLGALVMVYGGLWLEAFVDMKIVKAIPSLRCAELLENDTFVRAQFFYALNVLNHSQHNPALNAEAKKELLKVSREIISDLYKYCPKYETLEYLNRL